VIAAAEVDRLSKSKQLLEACDLTLESEEEIISLMDSGTDDYRSAHQNHDLRWQQSLSL